MQGAAMHVSKDFFNRYLKIGFAVVGLLTAGVSSALAQSMGTSSTSSGFGTSGGTSGGFGSSSSGFGSSSSTGGTSFTGGTGGTSFTGGTSNPMSNTSGGARGGAGSSSYPGVSTNNPFYSYYVNPFAVGLPSTSGFSTSTTATKSVAFGTPLYTTTNTSNSMGTANISGTNQGYPGANSIGTRRAPAYTTAVAFEITRVKPTVVQSQVQSMLSKSSKILSKDTIVVALDGDALVLRGLAKDDHERRLAEALVRLTPGVRNVRNELAVPEIAPDPRRVSP
jgi:hypothetical protein